MKNQRTQRLDTRKNIGLIQNETEVHLQVENIYQWPPLHVWDSQ